MPTMNDIEQLTQAFAQARTQLAERVAALEEEMNAAKRRRIAGIKRAVATAAEAHDRLQAAIADARELFTKPKSQIFHGVRVGYQKAPGVMSWADEQSVIKLIRRHFPEQAEVLIKTTETPIKKALGALPAADLKKIGVTIADTGDVVLIKPTDSEIDKLVDALLADAQAKVEAE